MIFSSLNVVEITVIINTIIIIGRKNDFKANDDEQNMGSILPRVNQKPSSNAFSSTSLKATSSMKKQRNKRLNQNTPYNNTHNSSSSESNTTLTAAELRIKEKRKQAVNINEACFLFELSSIGKIFTEEEAEYPSLT